MDPWGCLASRLKGTNAVAVSSETNVDYVQIMTKGNGVDFGDKTDNGSGGAGCSNGHGGLG